MIYLETFTFPDADREFDFFISQKRTCYDSFYPFQILPKHHFERIDYEPITILYGGNGTGKSTVLNIIAEKLSLARDSAFNHSNFFPDYLKLCGYTLCASEKLPENSLSPARQQELVRFIEDSARFFGCQFIISTHSPFVLSLKGAKIYDLDEDPVDVKRWTELENVRIYYDFFREHEREFT